ncbi:MAG: M20/M25/M40 family metallo-hydrolase [Chitinophagaceae bacterium]|nr:M20/M25/M40 family metallo-hydrolase [Chitinophagaceae bacterium]
MKNIFLFLSFIPTILFGQKLSKVDKIVLNGISTHISFLADDNMEGRRAGTKGEILATKYIQNQFKDAFLNPLGDNLTYLQSFSINDGKNFDKASFFFVNGIELKPFTDYFPLNNSSDSKLIEAAVSISLSENGAPWFLNWEEIVEMNKSNPHFDYKAYLSEKVSSISKKGGTIVIIYNLSSSWLEDLAYTGKDQSEPSLIPIVAITPAAQSKYFRDNTSSYDLKLKIVFTKNERIANNVIGYLDNKAQKTIVFGAHFDHLGYGEDGNSMLRTKEKLIHNGADDNASGTAVLIELAKNLKKERIKDYNFLFIAFSGEELGLLGSKYFTDHPTIDLEKVSYMVNMDMVGRLNDSLKTLTIGGVGTSPIWGNLLPYKNKSNITIKIDSSGTGPSDHTSFYRKNIPVLFFFTGLHTDYHKPSDDYTSINFSGSLAVYKIITSIVKNSSGLQKLAFTKTKEQSVGSSTRFTVSLGIMPDYSYPEKGVRVDGISEGKLAQKVGIVAGDIIMKLGSYQTSTVTSYMEALSKFKKGDSTSVSIQRKNQIIELSIQF